jgi:fructose-bisphosphate aldolase, class II
MALISLRQLLDHAAEHGYGVPAFNVNNMEQMRAIMQAAHETDSPVIVQASAGARKYAGEPFLRHLILAAIEMYPHIPVVMHQDHGASPAVCQRSIQSGFSSVMMDGSLMEDMKTPASYEYNVDVTRAWSRWPTPAACPSKASSAAWARSRPAWPARKTAPAPRASSITPSC